MPEIMSQNFFPAMRENCEIPILPLIMDEQTGKAGYITRLEAFDEKTQKKKRAGACCQRQIVLCDSLRKG